MAEVKQEKENSQKPLKQMLVSFHVSLGGFL